MERSTDGINRAGDPFHADKVVEPQNALPQFELDDLPKDLREAAARAGWDQLLPVQGKAIPYILAKRNLMIQSRTGSGKTGAFLLPILARIDPKKVHCQALVLVPTRELARQVTKEAEVLAGDKGVRTVAVYGGVGYGAQMDAFRQGAHLVVGTPGRILDHLIKQSLSLNSLEILVFDEADRMLSMGFYPDMQRVKSFLPSRPISGYMFSATFPPLVLQLAGEFLHKPEVLSLSRDCVHVAETEHVYYVVPAMKKDRSLIKIIELENPSSAIIFCNTRARVHYLSVVLKRFGYDADELSSDLAQNARERVMGRIKAKTLRFLVATDVAARGIDIPNLSHVIQYEPPEDHESYVHRAGRTGRVGASGVAISLVADMEQLEVIRIGKRFGIEFEERHLPSDEEVEELVSERITAMLEAELRTRDKLQIERMQRFIPLARSLGQFEDELAIVAMLLDDYYQGSLHAAPAGPLPEEPPEPQPRPEPPRGGGRRGDRSRGPRRDGRGDQRRRR